MNLQQHWDASLPGMIGYPGLFGMPVLKGRIAVAVGGVELSPYRIRTDGKVFHLDVFLRDGRTLRMIAHPSHTCRSVPTGEFIPLPPHDMPERLRLPARDQQRAVTDADRLTVELA